MYDYQSKDVFVRDTIGKSLKYDKTNVGSSTQEYSVWIKTITPEELNNNPQWVDLADLVFVQRFNHTTAIADLYKTKDAGGQYYNRFMKSPVSNAFEQSKSVFGGTYDSNDYPGYAGKTLPGPLQRNFLREWQHPETLSVLYLIRPYVTRMLQTQRALPTIVMSWMTRE